ncbi:MAG: TonB-dependent receptor, partial [Nitrospirales bacterium]
MFGFLSFFFIVSSIFFSAIPSTVVFAAESLSGSPDEDVQELGEYIVSDTRLPAFKSSTYAIPSKVSVITSDDIQALGARTVQEAIQYSTGVVLYDAVGNNFEQTIDLRGFNGQPFPSTTVFVDGVRINDPDTNTVNFELIPIESIDRIEIYPGSSAI